MCLAGDPGRRPLGCAQEVVECGPCEGNYALPSGRRLHALANVVAALTDTESRARRVTVRAPAPLLAPGEGWALAAGAAAAQRAAAPGGPRPAAVYLAFEDMVFEAALSHWLTEMLAAASEVFAELRALHPRRADGTPGIQLLLSRRHGFKGVFLRAAGFAADEVAYAAGYTTAEGATEAELYGPVGGADAIPHSCSNLVYFPPFLDWLSEQGLQRFQRRHTALLLRLHRAAGLPYCGNTSHPDLQVLCVGRHAGTGFAGNEGVHYPRINELCGALEAAFGSRTLYAETVQELGQELEILRSARVVVTTYGSAMLFQGVIARNATVLALGECYAHEASGFPGKQYERAQQLNEMAVLCSNMGLLPDASVGPAMEAKVVNTIATILEQRALLNFPCEEPLEE